MIRLLSSMGRNTLRRALDSCARLLRVLYNFWDGAEASRTRRGPPAPRAGAGRPELGPGGGSDRKVGRCGRPAGRRKVLP